MRSWVASRQRATICWNVTSWSVPRTTSCTVAQKARSLSAFVSSRRKAWMASSPWPLARPTWYFFRARSLMIAPLRQTRRYRSGSTRTLPAPTSELLMTRPACTTSPFRHLGGEARGGGFEVQMRGRDLARRHLELGILQRGPAAPLPPDPHDRGRGSGRRDRPAPRHPGCGSSGGRSEACSQWLTLVASRPGACWSRRS